MAVLLLRKLPKPQPLPRDGLSLWFDPGSGVGANSWADRMGNCTLSVHQSNTFPTLVSGGLNNRNYFSFNGTTNWIRGAIANPIGKACVYLVCRWNDTQGLPFELNNGNASANGNTHTQIFNDSGYESSSYILRFNPISAGFAGRVELTSSYSTPANWAIYAMHSISNRQFRAKIYRAGSLIDVGTSADYGGDWIASASWVGMGNAIVSGLYAASVDIADTLVYSGVNHDDSTAFKVIDFLRRKYAL